MSSEPTVAVGVLAGEDEYQLVDVADAARRSDGSLVVVDRGARVVRAYDSTGKYRMTLGGPGSGPGEFTDPGPVLVDAGDTVTVWDGALLRLTRFTPEGELAGTRTVDWGKVASGVQVGSAGDGDKAKALGKGWVEGLYPGPMEPLPDGSLLVRLVEKTAGSPPSGYHRPRSGLLRASEDLSVVDTLLLFPDTEQFIVDAPWGPFGVVPPLPRGTVVAHGGNPSRICVGDQAESEVACRDAGGRWMTIRWQAEALPVGEGEIEAWRERKLQALGPKLSRSQVGELLEQVPLPEARPPFSQLFLDPEGNLWVERGPGSEGITDFLVFDPRGALLGTVVLPSVRVLEIGDDYVLGVHEDELGVQYLRVYELQRAP